MGSGEEVQVERLVVGRGRRVLLPTSLNAGEHSAVVPMYWLCIVCIVCDVRWLFLRAFVRSLDVQGVWCSLQRVCREHVGML